MNVVPIAVTRIDMNALARNASLDLRRSVTRSADSAGIEGCPAELAALMSFGNNTPQLTAMSVHSFSFYVSGYLNLNLPIKILASEKCEAMILSGSLLDWKYSVVAGCHQDADIEIRRVFNQIFSFFCQIKLRDVWSEFSREDNHDNTFSLKAND